MNKLNFIKTLICTLVIFSLASCGVEEITGTGGATLPNNNSLQTVIESGNLAALSGSTDALVNNTLAHLTDSANYTANTEIVAIYATETGSGDYSGTNWTNAIAAANLRNRITNITDASASKVYAVLVAGGTYKPTYDGDRTISFSMKNHVAVIGGFDATGSWELTGTTTFSGDIGTVGNTNDNTYRVFSHDYLALENALLYGVTISDGRANGNVPSQSGGGMYNNSSSPRLFNVVFSGNYANYGAGMYNNSSSPRLFNVVFSNNSVTYNGKWKFSSAPVLTEVSFISNNAVNGGGMYNYNSSPVLTEVSFISNNAPIGGGMYNNSSSPRLFNVVFSGNTAGTTGGGMYNTNSSPVLTGVEFTGNSAALRGGGMFNESSSSVLTNVVFSGNTARTTGGGMYNTVSSPRLFNVVFSGNTAGTTGGGMYNMVSSPQLFNVVFSGNSATLRGGGMYDVFSAPVLMGAVFAGNRAKDGGAMYNDNDAKLGPLIVNTIFARNTASGSGQDIAMRLDTSAGESIRIVGSVLGIGLANPVNGIVGVDDDTDKSINLTHHSLANGAVNFGPNLTISATSGGGVYPTIQSSSGAVDIGLYVRRSGADYYFSEDNATWYTAFTDTGVLTGPAGTPPAGAEDLTARDIAGNTRVGRPDAGVYEYKP